MQSMIVSQQQLMRRKANDLSYLSGSINKNNLNDYSVDKSSDEKKCQLDTNDQFNEPQSDEPSTSTQLEHQENTSSSSNIKFRRATSSTADYLNNRNSNCNLNKRQATSWFNFLPTYKTRAEEFKKYFGHIIPSNERFIVDYSCAYQREILAQGRMYISLNYICFYANILSWETNLVIKCKDIKQISKTNTALIIPNAISIVTNSGDKYFFASYVTREKTYSMLYKIWQNSLIDNKLNLNDISETSKLAISKELIWDLIHDNYGDLGYTKEEEKLQKSFDESSSKEKLNDSDSSSDSDLYLDSDTGFNEMNNKPELDLINKQKTLDKNEKFSCLCTEHEGSEIFNETFPMTVDQMFTLAFDDSPFFRMLQKMRNSTVLGIQPWKDENDDQNQQTNDNKNSKQQLKKKSRELKFKLQLNNALAKYVDVCELQFLDEKSVPGYYYMIYSKCQNSNVPFADTFRVFTTFCFARGSSFKECNLQVHSRVEFVKSGFGLSLMKGTIESSSIKGVKDYCDFLSKQLNQWCKEKSLERRQNLNSFKQQYKLEYDSSNEDNDQEADDDDDDEDDFILSNDNLSFGLNDETSLLSKTNSINRKVFPNKRYKSSSLSTISTNRLFTSNKQQNTPTTSFWKFKQNELILFIIFIILFLILLIILFIFKRLIDLELIIRKYEDDLFKFDRLIRITTNLSNQQSFIEFFNQSNSSTILNLAETWANLINQTDQTIRSIKSVYLAKHHSLDKSFNDGL